MSNVNRFMRPESSSGADLLVCLGFDHRLRRTPPALRAMALLAAFSAPLCANVSLALLPGTTAVVRTPAAPPFTSLGDTRLELRLHDWSTPASDATIFRNAGFKVELRANSELCGADLMDALPAYGDTMCADIAGRSDVTLRLQRDTGDKLLRYEVFASAGDWSAPTYCGTKRNGSTASNTFPCPIGTVYLDSWAGDGAIGDPYSNLRIAWIKWHSTLVPAAGGSLGEAAPADLADFRFEGGLADQSTGAYGVSLSPLVFQPLPADTASGGALYVPSPTYPPVCSAGSQQVFRAGYPAELDATGSYPFDSGALAYSWRQISGPSTVSWSDHSAPRPVVAGLLFGSYVFELTVTDHARVSTACTVKHGAVVSDDNGVVITNNAAVDTLLGPMVRFGANPWPWFDDRHKAEADMQAANLDLYYGAYWDPASPAYGSAAAQSAWLYNAAPANYYDNVAAFYALYYRSGIDDYLTAARKLADRFWASPMVNAGTTCNAWVSMANCYPARSLSVLGLVLRALDGRPDMWPGLNIIFDSYRSYYLDLADVQWGFWDTREMAYHLAVVSYCALFDPDISYRQNCQAAISYSFTTIWNRARAADGSFPALYSKTSSWDTGSAAALTHGSTTVTGVGTNWDAGSFQCYNAVGHGFPCQVWFTDATSKPASNADGDTVLYTATVVDATHLTIDRPYEGATGVHGWALPDANAGLIGFGAQPFIEGLLGFAFDMAGRAIAASDPATSAVARNYNAGIAQWLRTTGYWRDAKGMYYGAGFVNCQPPISSDNPFCTGGNSVAEARVLNAETMRSVMAAYDYTGDVALKSFADSLYSAMFSKPGSGGPNPDGYYIDALDDGTGWYMIGVPPVGKAPKYFGMLFGIGGLSAWPAWRVGGFAAADDASVTSMPAGPPRVPAARIQGSATAPAGAVSHCAAASCSIRTGPREGVKTAQ